MDISIALILLNVVVNLDLCNGSFDLEYPIVLSEKFSQSESHFGYSVTLMKSTHPTSVNGWILIGAPKSNSTDPTYLKSGQVYEPGVIWRCSLGGKKGNETCEILNLDPIPNKHGTRECTYNSCQDFPQLDSKYASWLGGSISSIDDPSGKFVTCAHRWTRGNFTLMNGLCYFLPTKDINRHFDGNSAPLIDRSTYSHRLVPFFERGKASNQYFAYDLGEHKNFSVQWALGQAGISTHMARRDTGIELLVGAPGVFVWSGAVIRYRDGRPEEGSIERKNRKDAYETDFASYSISTRPFSPSNWHDYFGYAVTSGKFDASGQVLYVGGAPRGGRYLYGEVVVFKIPLKSKEDEVYTLQGKQLGSYFGSVLMAVDINGDGIDELFVAAPLLSREIRVRQANPRSLSGDPDAIATSAKYFKDSGISSGDQGCVYLYSGEKQLRDEVEPYLLTGDENLSIGSRFGSAMSSLSDINGDGLNDFAIGAPYENDGKGAVYIFYGTRDNIPQIHQKITPEIFTHPVSSAKLAWKGFGCSFSGGNDIDGNGTPDLAIGSYISDSAVVLRTRPVIEIKGDIKFIINNGRTVEVLGRGVRTFNINSGVKFIRKLGKSQEKLKVLVLLTFDSNYNRYNITSIGNGPSLIGGKTQNEWQYEDRISEKGLNIYSFKASLITEHNASDPSLPAFVVQQKVIYNGIGTDQKFRRARLYTILGNNNIHVEGPAFDDFCSTCVGSGEIRTDFPLALSNEECVGSDCIPILVGNAGFRLPGRANASRMKEFILGSSNEVVLDILVKNEGQTATKPVVEIFWQKSEIQISGLPPGCTGPRNTNPGILVTCSLGDFLRNKNEQAVEIVFNMADVFSSHAAEKFQVDVEVLTLQEGNRHVRTKLAPELKLLAEAKVRIFGSPHKNIMWTTKFRHTYEVQLEGPSPVATVMLGFKIPVNKTIDGVHRQILLVSQPDYKHYNCIVRRGAYQQIDTTTTEIPLNPGEDDAPGEDGGRPTPPSADYEGDNEIEIASRVGIPRRQKRSTDEYQAPRSLAMNKRKKVTVDSNTLGFSCNDLNDQTVQCMEVECTIKNLKSGVLLNIVFDFTIVNETAYKLLQSVEKDSLLIESSGTASTHSPASKDDDISQTTLETLSPKEVPVYVYILAVIGGIVLLVVVTTILYKFGFFKREIKQKLDEKKAAAEDARKSLITAEFQNEQTYQNYDQSESITSQTQANDKEAE